MPGITERDVAYDLLYGTKSATKLYCDAAIESAHHDVFHMFRELEHNALETQHRIWDYLHRRSEYRVSEAQAREIDDCRQRMEHLAQDHLVSFRGGRSEYARQGYNYNSYTTNTGTNAGYGQPTYAQPTYGQSSFGQTGYSQAGFGSEPRSDWTRNEGGSRHLPEWTREAVRR